MIPEPYASYFAFASISFFLIETVIYVQLKRLIKEIDLTTYESDFSRILIILSDMNSQHLVIYSTVYFMVLLVCRFFPLLLPMVLLIQIISIFMDFYILKRL